MKKDILPEQGIEKLIDLASEFLKSYGEKGYMGHSTYIGAMVDFHLKMQKDSLSPVGEVTESRIKEMAKEHSEMLKMTNWDSLGDVFKQAEIGFEYGFKECLEMMRSQALSSTEKEDAVMIKLFTNKQGQAGAEVFINGKWVKEISGLHDHIHTLEELSKNEDFRQLIEPNTPKQ